MYLRQSVYVFDVFVALGKIAAGTATIFSILALFVAHQQKPTTLQLIIAPGTIARVLAMIHVARIAIIRQSMGNETIIAGYIALTYRGNRSTNRTPAFLSNSYLIGSPRLAFNQDIHLARRIFTNGNRFQNHILLHV